VVTHQLQVERRTGKVRQSETDVLPLCHASNILSSVMCVYAWNRFRHNWLVERSGKWAEPDYPAMVYPKFACGAGYVLSSDLVHWLDSNADVLAAYQVS